MSSAQSVGRYNRAMVESRVFRAAMVEALRLQVSRNWNQCLSCGMPGTCKKEDGCKLTQASCPIEKVLRETLAEYPEEQ